MHTPAQEAIAQFLFWSGIGCLPISIALSIIGFRLDNRAEYWLCFILAGVLLTHFLWYFAHLGIALSDTLGRAHYPPWYRFSPMGIALIYILLLCRESMRRHKT